MSKKITMKDIAEKLDLSINAVSLVLNKKAGVSEDTRKQVLKVAEELGYFDAKPQYLSTYASMNLCLVLEHRFFKDPYFYSKVIIGIEEEAKKNGYDLIVNFIDNKDYVIPNCLESRKATGIIALGTMHDEYISTLKSYGLPMVLVDNTSLSEPIDSILTDNKSGAYKATRYLSSNGLKKIGFFGDLDYSFSIKERYFGFTEAVKDMLPSGFKPEEYFQKYSITSDVEEYIIKNDTNAICNCLKELEEVPEAFVCSNDSAALIISNALSILGYKVPEDVSIIGFDDIALCSMVLPKMTTVRVHKEAMGRKAVQRLIWRMRHGNEPVENTIMSVELIERESVKKAEVDKTTYS